MQTKAKLDYETKTSYMVTVTATDSGGLSASIDVTIMVTEVDEAPEIAGEDIAEDFRENGSNLEIERFRATDPEDRKVYWSLLEAFNGTPPTVDGVALTTEDIGDAGHFMISSDGVLSFKFSPDYEMPRDAPDPDNTYKVVVVASDDALGAEVSEGEADEIKMGYKKVTVTVTNVEETETVTLSARQAQENVSLMATYNDLDNERPAGINLTWKWYLSGSPILNAGANDIGITSTYIPVKRGSLRAEASYIRTDGSAKTVWTTVSVRTAPAAANAAPNFGQGANARSVDENSAPGTRVGNPVAATDRLGDVLTYTLSGTDADDYSIDQATGQITVGPRTMLDREEPNESNIVMVTATDPAGGPDGAKVQQVIITINDVNEAPVMTQGFTRISQPEYDADDTEVNAAKVVDTYTATDVDQDEAVSWSVSGTDAGDFMISDAGALTFKEAPNYEMPADSNGDNVYKVTVVATDAGVDSKNKMTAERAVVVTVTNVDEDGTVTLSSEQPKIGIALTATLEDPDGVVASSVKWTWHNATAANVVAASTVAAENAIPMATSDTYTPTLMEVLVGSDLSAKASYTDGYGANKEAVGGPAAANTVAANLANVAPEFPEDETGIRKVAENTPAGMAINDAVAATDANELTGGRHTLTYTLSGTDEASFDIARSSGQLQTKAELDYETKTSYMVTVTATDPDAASASIDVTITVTDEDEAPEIMLGGLTISGPSMAYYAENRMDAVETYMANGPMAGRARWSLAGEDVGDFMLASDGVLKFRSSPNYEMPRDADTDNTYKVTVKANDGTYTDTQDVIVMVTDVEELGTLSGNSRHNYMENGEDAVATYTPSGPDNATWSLEGADKGYFTITDGMLKFRSSPNYEMPRDADTDNIYMVTVKAQAGGEMDDILVAVTVDNVEELGMLSGLETVSNYMENSEDAVGTYTVSGGSMSEMANLTLMGADMGDFTITDGVLSFRSAPDYEMPRDADTDNIYMVTVKAEAGGEIDMVDVTITVTDEDDPGTVSLSSMQPVVGVTLTASLTDPDGSTSGITWQWASSDTSGGTYINISGAMSASYTPVEADEGDYLRATASYTDGHGSGKSASAMTAMTAGPVTFEISGQSDFNYMENDTDAVGPYTASGPGATSAIWTLEGNDAGDFEVEGSGESVMLKFSSPPDYENAEDSGTDNTYTVTVMAEAGGETDEIMVTVDVTNVEELGTLAGDSNPSYEEGSEDAVGTYTASDGSMSEMANWSLAGDDMGDLSISTSGVLTFDATPDYEMPMDEDTDNTYKVTVMAEAGGEMKEIIVIVMVTNANEDGTVTLMPLTPSVGTEITADLTDPDIATENTDTWQWSKSMTMDGTYVDIDMATSMSYTPMTADVGYYLRATVMYTDGHGPGKAAMETTTSMVTAAADPLLVKYEIPSEDGEIDGKIDRREAIAAIRRYLAGEAGVTRAEVIAVIRLYLGS